MKFRLFAALALVFALAGPEAQGGNTFPGDIALSLVSLDIGPTGVTKYRFAGIATPGDDRVLPNFEFTGECAYDPQQKRAAERLTENTTGSYVSTSATCPADPWRNVVACTGATASTHGDSPGLTAALTFSIPITSQRLSSFERENIISTYTIRYARMVEDARAAKAAADKAAAKAAADKAEAERRAKLAAQIGAVSSKDESFHAYVVKTPTPAPYGATYSSNSVLASLSVNQTTFLPVTVKNTSSQTWPAGGLFRLAYHWYRGGAELIHDGARTLMPAAVAPGASVTLNAKIIAPSSAGASALRWDMVEENVAWFSDKGVAMGAPQNVNVTP